MVLRRPLRVLMIGRQDNFARVLAINVRRWGHEIVLLPAESLPGNDILEAIDGDVLLYDLDEPVQKTLATRCSPAHRADAPLSAAQRSAEKQWPHVRFTIVLSSRSVSRTMLEQIGAIALLQKPFAMGRLQRYLRVLQRLLRSDEPERTLPRQTLTESTRVLVVDDDRDVAHAIRQCLIYEPGYEVAVAHDGLEALERCLDWHPQCVVTDLIMPWMNGYQVMRCLSAGALQTMPAFVVMSALTQLERPVNRSYLEGKAVAYVDKPFHIDHLLTAIKQVCAG